MSNNTLFVCEICGKKFTGYNKTVKDFPVNRCLNGHIFCQSHSVDNDFNILEECSFVHGKIKKYKEYNKQTNSTDKQYKIREYNNLLIKLRKLAKQIENSKTPKLINSLKKEIQDRLIKQFGYFNCFGVNCPLCSFELVNNKEMNTFILKATKFNYKKLKRQIKKRFKTYNNFRRFLGQD